MRNAHELVSSTKRNIIGFFQSRTWEDALFLLMLAFLLLINHAFLSKLMQLPSPLYGGDYYNHLGTIEHMYQGGNIFESAQLPGEIPWVPWLYHLLVVIFAKVSGLSTMFANIYFSQVALVLGSVMIYAFISKMFNKQFGLISILWFGTFFPLYKYSPFSFYISFPLLVFAAYLFLKQDDYKRAIFLGVAYGLAGISNTFIFMQGSIFIGLFLVYYAFYNSISFSKKIHINKVLLRERVIKAAIIFIIGFLISLLWWYEPIFVYHAKTVNDLQTYGFKQYTPGLFGMIEVVTEGLKGEFFSYSTPYMFFTQLGALIGIGLLLFLKNRKAEHTLLLLLILSGFVGLCIHFITLPLLGTSLPSGGLFGALMILARPLLFFFAIYFASKYLSKLHSYAPLVLLALVALLFSFNLSNHIQTYPDEYWYKNTGRTPISPHITELRTWLLANTDLNDVFLTTNEDSFALNAISGRKVVTFRRTHASTYADMNKRAMDAGIMLYASDDEDRLKLLKEYSVDYIYWQPGWIRNEFQIDEEGKVQGFFDPLMVEYNPEREAILKKNNVSVLRTQTYLDPAWLPSYPKRDVMVIIPGRMNPETPWSESLDKYLELVHEINLNGQIAGRIYKVNISAE